MNLKKEISDVVWNSVWGAVCSSVNDSVSNSVGNSVWGLVYDSVDGDDSAVDLVWHSVRHKIKEYEFRRRD
jgi:hypothetical protein